MAFSGRPASASLYRRTAPRPGDMPRLAACTAVLRPGPGPGPGRALRSAARHVAAPGPSPLYEPAAGPSRARSAPSRDPRFARRARGPRGARFDAAGGRVICEAAGVRALRSAARTGPLPDRVRSTSRQPGPSRPGLRCHVTHAARRARGPRRGARCGAAGGRGSS
jgi:hypothetical protein